MGTGQRPVVIDLCCGLGGWSKAFIAEGWDAIGFDIEEHCYPGETRYSIKRYPGHLILKSILELNGYDLKHAINPSLIVASPPCQEYSYMAMPFSRGKKIARGLRGEKPGREMPLFDGWTDADEVAAKQIAAALRGKGEFPEGYTGSRTLPELTALYRACFRIARECGVPIVLENVKGAQPWVGRAQANYGSYYLWGDVANVGGRIVRAGKVEFGMPAVKAMRAQKANPDGTEHGVGSWFAIGSPGQTQTGGNPVHELAAQGVKTVGHANIRDGHTHTQHLTNQAESDAVKHGGDWFSDPASPSRQGGSTKRYESDQDGGTKQGGDGFRDPLSSCAHGSKSPARKAASAMIAEIPFDLARHIARVFKP